MEAWLPESPCTRHDTSGSHIRVQAGRAKLASAVYLAVNGGRANRMCGIFGYLGYQDAAHWCLPAWSGSRTAATIPRASR